MQIIFNGKTYSSPDDMPPEERSAFEKTMGIFAGKGLVGREGLLADENEDGIPDILERFTESIPGAREHSSIVFESTKYNVNGRDYSSLEELPPEIRKKLERLAGKDPGSPSPSTPSTPSFRSREQPSGPAARVHQDPEGGWSFGKLLVVAGLVIVLAILGLNALGLFHPPAFLK